MNFTQNDRLKQVTSDTLIAGGDVGLQTYFCRAFDCGFELSRRVFKFSDTGMGFLTFLRWTEELNFQLLIFQVEYMRKSERPLFAETRL